MSQYTVCPQCGNQVGPGESFCGQCGAALTPLSSPGQATQMVSGPLGPGGHSGLLRGYPQTPLPPSGPLPPQGAVPRTPVQQTDFYGELTEALPAAGSQGVASSPQTFGGNPPPGAVYGPGGQQPFQTPPYQSSLYRPAQTGFPQQGYPSGQAYGGGQAPLPPRLTPPPKPDHRNTWLVFTAVSAVVLLILLLVLGAVLLTRGSSPTAAGSTVTVAQSPTATPSPTPTPTPTPSPTPTPTPTPTPAATPTPTPYPGFSWCGQCVNEGFVMQYPGDWTQSSTEDGTGFRFTSPDSTEIFASFRALGPSGGQTPDQLVANDIQALQPPASAVSPTATTTIAGTTWRAAAADYQPQQQLDHIQVYATVYQGKAYLIEIQAPHSLFQRMNDQYFATMLGTFQFVVPWAGASGAPERATRSH